MGHFASLIAVVGISSVAMGGVIDDFERATLNPAGTTQTWSPATRSSIQISTTKAYSGSSSFLWTYNDNNVDDWGNEISMRFATPQDWSSATQISFYFDSGTYATSTTGVIFFSYGTDQRSTGGTQYQKVDGGSSVGSFSVTDTTPGFTKITLSLGAYTRDQVTQISFYVYGKSFGYAGAGQNNDYQFYLDDIAVNTVPEVASLNVLSIGMILLAGKWNKKRN